MCLQEGGSGGLPNPFGNMGNLMENLKKAQAMVQVRAWGCGGGGGVWVVVVGAWTVSLKKAQAMVQVASVSGAVLSSARTERLSSVRLLLAPAERRAG